MPIFMKTSGLVTGSSCHGWLVHYPL